FDAAYADLERSLFGTARTYVALAPVIGLSSGSEAELGADIRLRPVVAGEISQLWPEAQGLMPPEFGRDVDRMLVLELHRELAAELRGRLVLADEDRELGESLDRWELSLFSEEPFRSAQVREALACLLGGEGGGWAASLRAAVLLAEKGTEREEVLAVLRGE